MTTKVDLKITFACFGAHCPDLVLFEETLWVYCTNTSLTEVSQKCI